MPSRATRRLELTLPDDWHVHLRDDEALADVAAATAAQFGRAMVMPNLRPPVRTVDDAIAYRDRILAALPADSGFRPLMTLYLTDTTEPAALVAARSSGVVHGVKLYPAGATTNSDAGVTATTHVDDALAAMAESGLPLLVHGEVTRADVDIFDREARFLTEILGPLLHRHPRLKVVLEHITTQAAAEFVADARPGVAATITAHHLLCDRNDMLAGGIRPHLYCLPILKRSGDRRALVAAATSGSPRYFLGTDSAPHAVGSKLAACGCAGCYTAPAALALYAEAFDAADRLDRLEAFASHYGADFYGLPRNEERVALVRTTVPMPASLRFGDAEVIPFRAGEHVAWRLERFAESAAQASLGAPHATAVRP
jgi:dihydroorotase